MKYAQILVLPQTPPGGLTAGIDWASADHVACVDASGQVRARFSITHDRAGIGKLIAGLRAAGVSEAAIERSDGVLAVNGQVFVFSGGERDIRPVKVAQAASCRTCPPSLAWPGSPSSAPSCPPPGSGVQDHFSLRSFRAILPTTAAMRR